MTLLQIIDALASTSSRNDKLRILNENFENSDLVDLLTYALSADIRYFIRAIPDFTPSEVSISDAEFMQVLRKFKDTLVDRSITGNDAIEFTRSSLASLSRPYADLLIKVIRRDLRCGVGIETVNKVWDGLLPVFPVMLAQPENEKNLRKINYPAFCQLKADGGRITAIVDGGEVKCYTRAGNSLDALEFNTELISAFAHMGGAGSVAYDGEMLAYLDGKLLPRKQSNGIVNKIIKGTATPEEANMIRVVVWDRIPLDEFYAGKGTEKYSVRLAALEIEVVLCESESVEIIESEIVADLVAGKAIAARNIAKGLEGAMLKNMDALWVDDRSPDQVKIKAERECELRCVGFNFGTVGTSNEHRLGSLQFESEDRLLQVNISGFSDDERNTLTAENTYGRVATIRYNERSTNKKNKAVSLSFPRFICWREDKFVADTIDLIE